MPQKPTIPRICDYCTGEFLARPGDVNAGNAKFCSRKCFGENQKGDKNPNWKGGISQDKVRYKENYQNRYPERAVAHKLTQKEIKNGRLTKKPCDRCGSTVDVHAHHPDYKKPLFVRWLCRKCHNNHHRRERPVRKLTNRQIETIRKGKLSDQYYARKFKIMVQQVKYVRSMVDSK